MNIVNFLTSNVLATCQSEYNGEIKVVEQFGQRKIYAGGLLQSGSIIKQLWKKPLRFIGTSRDLSLPYNILILGFGGGTAAQLLFKQFPNAQITGVEIDPVMIEIYQKYFKPVETQNLASLQLIQEDCFHWISKCTHKYDLILVDLYQGSDIPSQLYEDKFTKKLKIILNSSGSLLINHLFFDNFKDKVPKLIQTLEKEFSDTKLIRNLSNLFLVVKNS